MPRRKVTGEVLEGMAELRKRGLTYGEIAGKLKVCPKTVAEHMRKAGLGGMRKVTGEVLERMRELRAKGLTYKEIAGKTGLSLPTVAKYMRKGRLGGRRGKGKRTRVTPGLLERMADMRKRGLTYMEIAGKLGVCSETVAKHVRKAGLGGRRRKVTGEVLEEMRRLRKEGLSYGKIADKLGLSYETVLNYLEREGGLLARLRRRLGLG